MKRYIRKDKPKTLQLQAKCSEPRASVWWDNQHKNYLVYFDKGVVDEFLTGKPFSLSTAIGWIKRVKRKTPMDELRKAERTVERNKQKQEERMGELHREVAKELCNHTRDPMVITGKKGERVLLNPKKKLSFHIERK